jgi:hypothetical protein
MPHKIALLNGRLYDPLQRTFEKTNILLIKNKIAGIGYIPDDDDSHQIDIKDNYIFSNIFLPVVRATFKNSTPSNTLLTQAQQYGITGCSIIPTQKNQCYGHELAPFLTKNHTHGLNILPLHCTTPKSPQMIGLWVTPDTPAITITATLKFNKALISETPYTLLKPFLTAYPSARWHIMLQKIEDLSLFNTLLKDTIKLSLSIPTHFITTETIETLLPYIKNQLIQSIHCTPKNGNSLLHCFPLLEDHLTITDIHDLYSGNILALYKLKLKGVAINHSPHLTIFDPKTGNVKYTILNGKLYNTTHKDKSND